MKLPIEKEFKDTFVATFCATWCANNYNEYCMAGKHEALANPPIEDAIGLANDVWKTMREL